MRRFKNLFFALVLMTTFMPVFADVAIEGEQDIYIELINAADFPKYKFFIRYKTFHYDQGYQPGPEQVVYLEAGKHQSTGDRGSSSYLYAEGPKGELQSKELVGGSLIDHTDGVQYVLDRIRITKVGKKGALEFKVEERQLIGADGKVLRSIEKGEVMPLDAKNLALYILPLACMVGLLMFFLFRRKSATAAGR